VTTEKKFGLVVDYHGVSQELDSALSEFETEDLEKTWEKLEDDPGASIDSAARRAESYFKGLDLDDVWVCVAVFAADDDTEGDFKADLFEKFDADYRDFAWLMDRFLPNPKALRYVDRLTRLTRIRSYVRAQFLRVDANIDWSGVSAKVKDLINARIDAEVRELMKPVSILDKDFESKISELPRDEARASVMEHAIRAQIKERLVENPPFYEKLSKQVERIIAQMRQRVIDAAEACRQLARLRSELLRQSEIAAEHGMSEVSFAVYELLEQSTGRQAEVSSHAPQVGEERQIYRTTIDEGLKAVAVRLEEVMRQGQSIVDWQNRDDVQRMMRRDIKRELRKVDGLSEEQIEELARTMVEIARRKMAR
jgi:type I restriction enzyme R subunit